MNQKLVHGLFVRRESRHLSDEDREAIGSAVLPDLMPIPAEILEQTHAAARANRKVLFQAVLIFAAVLVLGILSKGYTFCLAIGSAILVMLIGAFILHLRAQIDETAVMMQIPVHHTEDSPTGGRAVCYLPDGKYLFRYDRNQPLPEIVCYIEFGKFTYCQYEKAVRIPEHPSAPETEP